MDTTTKETERTFYWGIMYEKGYTAHVLYETQEDALEAIRKANESGKRDKLPLQKMKLFRLFIEKHYVKAMEESNRPCRRWTVARFEDFEVEGQCGLERGHRGQCRIQD